MRHLVIPLLWGCISFLLLPLACELPDQEESPVPVVPSEVPNQGEPLKKDSSTSLLHNGDLIFQVSTSQQSKAIQLATGSQYSHVGLLYQEADGSWCVYEAVATVRCTDLDQWIQRGRSQHYVVKRLQNAQQVLTPARLMAMQAAGNDYLGTPYDTQFEWGNDRYYCSELVWKLYRDATGIELAPLATFGDMALNSSTVQQKIKERYGNRALPMDELVVAPGALFDSEHLKTVLSR